MRREIIQSKTEPNKNNLWLSEEGLKKYGKNGWEPLGGGISPNTPIVDSISGDELISINVNGENKAVRADELVKGGKEVFILTPDMFENTITVGEDPYPPLFFTDDGLNKFTEAVKANKIIGIDKTILNFGKNAAMPLAAGPTYGNYVFSTHVGIIGANNYVLNFEIFNLETTNAVRYIVTIVGKIVRFMIDMSADGSFYLEPSMFVEPAASETIPGLELMEVYQYSLIRAIDSHKIIKIEYNILAYLDMIATPYASYTPEGYFILDNILKTSDTAFQATVILPETNHYLTINYNNGVFTAKSVDMSDNYILYPDNYSTAEDFELLATAIENGKNIVIDGVDLVFPLQITDTNINLSTAVILCNPNSARENKISLSVGLYQFNNDGTYSVLNDGQKNIILDTDGDGTKFLADDGSYKEVALPPYIWDGTTSETIFEELNEACVAKRRIILVNDDKYIVFSSFRTIGNNLILIGYPESFGVTSTKVVEVATYKESDNSKQISSNKYNDISITSDTNITYNENVVPIQIPIFEGQLFFSDTVYNVTFPDDIKWSTDSVLEYKANHTYQFRIVNNLGVMKEFANA